MCAWRREADEIVIDGWQNGIADSAELGLADIRSSNIISQPSEAAVNFSLQGVTLPPVQSGVAFTCTDSTDRIAVTDASAYYEGMAVIINSVSGGTGLSSTAGSNTFFVTNIVGNNFQVSTGIIYVSVVAITADGSGTLSTAQLGTPADSVVGSDISTTFTQSNGLIQWTLILDTSGQLFFLGNGQQGTTQNRLYFAGNTNHSSTSAGLGIAVYLGYIFLFLGTNIDYVKFSRIIGTNGPNGNWHIGWQTITTAPFGHKALAALDNALYFCNSQTIGSIIQAATKTFDPTDSTTYTFNTSALQLPQLDYARCMTQLGVNLLVGGVLNFIYPWDRVSTSFNYPIVVAEAFIQRIVGTNASAYVFAGNRGRIYITNGSNIDLFKKFPDHLTGTENPYYTWGDALYLRNQLLFSVSATDNAGSSIDNFAGVWGVDLDTKALRMENTLSTGLLSGSVPVIAQMGNVNPAGNGYYAAFLQTTGKIDYSSSTPYTNYEAYIDTDIIPVGSFFNRSTNRTIEYKLAKPLVSGESVRISYRLNLTDSFTTVFTDSTVGAISGFAKVNFQKAQWLQLRIARASTASNPSYTRLREVRIR